MTSMVLNQTHVGCMVANVVLGKSASSFQMEVERLLRNNGLEWLSARQKAIWTAANHLRNGDGDAARSVYQENSISYHRGDLTPKGPYRPVVRGYVEASRPSVIRRYAAVLRFYTTLILPDLSEKQSEKAKSSITSPLRGEVPDDLRLFAHSYGAALRRKTGPLREGQSDVTNLHPNTYRYSPVRLSSSDRAVPLRSLAMSLLTSGYIPKGLEHTDPFALLTRKVPNGDFVGRITAIQEQGAKARVVAMPSTRLQLAFMPLHDYLEKCDEGLKTSVRTDQQRAVFGLLKHMEDKPAYATDLSSATDRFPRSLSLDMIKGMGLHRYAIALDDVSSAKWESPWGPISYEVGQPMGLLGSFPLFHLSNQMVASYAEHKAMGVTPHVDPRKGPSTKRFESIPGTTPLTRFPNGYTYYVLGDDIVFSDPRVESQYRGVMEEIGVDISDAKSFSGELTEFAGFVVTKSKGKPFAFRPYKPPPGDSVSNPVDFLAALGVQAKTINKYWDKQVSLFSRTWADRSPDLSPWVSQGEGAVGSPWDPAVLDNEFQLLSSRYPDVVPDLSPNVQYSSGIVKSSPEDPGFTVIGLSRNRSKDRPRAEVETSRKVLGQRPKHPKRRRNPLQADPLIRKVREELSTEVREAKREEESPVRDSPTAQEEQKLPPLNPIRLTPAKRSGRCEDPSSVKRNLINDWPDEGVSDSQALPDGPDGP